MKTFLIWDGSRCQTGGVAKQTISPLRNCWFNCLLLESICVYVCTHGKKCSHKEKRLVSAYKSIRDECHSPPKHLKKCTNSKIILKLLFYPSCYCFWLTFVYLNLLISVISILENLQKGLVPQDNGAEKIAEIRNTCSRKLTAHELMLWKCWQSDDTQEYD